MSLTPIMTCALHGEKGQANFSYHSRFTKVYVKADIFLTHFSALLMLWVAATLPQNLGADKLPQKK